MKLKKYCTGKVLPPNVTRKRKVRKHLNADAFIAAIRRDFKKIPDIRGANRQIPLDDALMSAFAMFQLKDPSLLAFDKRRKEEDNNLHAIWGIKKIPCDSQVRALLDPLPLSTIRPPFLSIFRLLQRGKEFEKMVFYNDHYLLSGDGTGFYCSEKVSAPYCMGKKKKNGDTLYHLQMYAGSFVKPGCKTVIPVCPEMIIRDDGSNKNDCERNAAKRFYQAFRREYPHLKVIVVEDALSSNGPHIRELQDLHLRFILGVKPGDHRALFAELEQATDEGRAREMEFLDPQDRTTGHFFKYLNHVPLNKSNPDLLVNVLEYSQIDKNLKITKFSWVTDIEITDENVYKLMQAGRARWKIENETFNTLKNRGYNLGHNYGLGKENLSGIFTTLMMLAFLVDQALELSCWLFQAALERARTKRDLWESMRGACNLVEFDSLEQLLRVLVFGLEEGFKT